MDGQRFDDLTRKLVRGRLTRRRLLKGAAGGVVAGVAGGTAALGPAPDAAEAACRGLGQSCLFGSQCCSGHCLVLGFPPLQLLRCACPLGATPCQGACKTPADFQGDPANCGACGRACAADETCQAGVCVCVPDCTGKACGDDGCGGSCGSCGECQTCLDGSCEAAADGTLCRPVPGCPLCEPACCSGTCCISGICDAGTGGCGCLGAGATCTIFAQCCSGNCSTAGTEGICLINLREPCDPNGPDFCVGNAVCCDGTCRETTGRPCFFNTDCCSGTCQQGHCA